MDLKGMRRRRGIIAGLVLLVFAVPAVASPEDASPIVVGGPPTGTPVIEGAPPPPAPPATPLRVHFIDVGHGDACLIKCPDGETILIDGGAGWDFRSSTAVSTVNRYLRERGVVRLDLVIASHPHADHIGGLVPVLREFPVSMLLEPGMPYHSATYRSFMDAIRAKPEMEHRIARAGQQYSFGEVALQILHPGQSLHESANESSIVCRLEYGGVSFLFTGDAGIPAEKEILQRRRPVRSTVLKVGHHGSTGSSGAPFLGAVSPRIAVISCAPRKTQQAEVVRRLQARRASVYKTDEHGTVIVETDGRELRVILPDRRKDGRQASLPSS
ncbi:MAG: MBL fold metallo-hydrolase [bacterium]|nr:MBL fold metallo-hydrolase [bacterium]